MKSVPSSQSRNGWVHVHVHVNIGTLTFNNEDNQPIDRNNGVLSIESDDSSNPRHQSQQLELERLSQCHQWCRYATSSAQRDIS